ncbi:MAG: hypothetical protein RLZZ508_415 [Actinomycetota bacterium]
MSFVKVLEREVWLEQARHHADKVAPIATQVRKRRDTASKHPIDDFMWDYYTLRPARLERWHPGFGIGLLDAPEYLNQRGYETNGGIAQVSGKFIADRSESFKWTLKLLRETSSREPKFQCFGFHEWAMLYKLEPNEIRHEQLPLRLSVKEIAEVVEAQELKCTHFDAFRFFVPGARSLNHMILTREGQHQNEQSGCLHANMDVYKWAYKSLPLISSELLFKAFELARDIRILDMQATPYDLLAWGYEPVKTETAEGKNEYVRRQREFHVRAQDLRAQLISQLEIALESIS